MLIAYALLSEILGVLIRDYEIFQIVYLDKYHFANNFIYNIYDIVFFLFFYNVFYKLLKNEKHKIVIKYGFIFYILATIVNPFFQNLFIFPQIYASTIGSLVLIICILCYYKEIGLRGLKKNKLLAWLSTGLLIFNLFFPIIMVSGKYNYQLYKELNFQQIHYFLIVVMYICFSVGFLRMERISYAQEDI